MYYKKDPRQQGSTLVETLVSLFILAVGLIGTVEMQVRGLNSNQRAQFATDANILAEDIANRILAYARNIDAANRQDTTFLDDYSGIDSRTTSATDPNCLTTGCSAALSRTFDEWQWANEVKRRLPNGVGTVNYADGAYKITVMWNNDQIETPTTNCSGSGSDLTCFVYRLKLE